jgi:hypothetical protein
VGGKEPSYKGSHLVQATSKISGCRAFRNKMNALNPLNIFPLRTVKEMYKTPQNPIKITENQGVMERFW